MIHRDLKASNILLDHQMNPSVALVFATLISMAFVDSFGRCQTLISSRDYHSLTFWFSIVELRCSTPVTAQSKGSLSVLIKNTKGYQARGEKGLFLDFSRPQLAQDSIWLAGAMELPPE